jgi:hypothetical protein
MQGPAAAEQKVEAISKIGYCQVELGETFTLRQAQGDNLL